MYRTFLALMTGIVLPGYLPQPLALTWLAGTFAGLLVLWGLARRAGRTGLSAILRGLLLVLLGLGWGTWCLHTLLANQLAPALEGQDVQLVGTIDSPVKRDAKRLKMVLTPHSASHNNTPITLPQRVQISWYRYPRWGAELTAGSRLALTVRLKRPRSFINPAGFDYKLWQLRRGVGATGYVRPATDNRRLNQQVVTGPSAALGRWLQGQTLRNRGLIEALLLGSRSQISEAQRDQLQRTGTSHLIAISGLHIGLAAGFGYLLALLLGKLLAPWLPWRAQLVALVGAALAAWAYSALAGFSLPTQRALAMLLMLYLTRVLRRDCGGGAILAGAALVVGVLDPLSVRDAGFWLSFVAVASLVLVFAGTLSPARRWRALWLPQWVVFVALIVPLGLYFGQVSLVAPLANMVAIPLVSVWVVPLLFAAALMAWLCPALAQALLWLADRGLDAFWWWLQTLAKGADALGWPVSLDWQPTTLTFYLLALAAVVLLLPKALGLRAAGVLVALLALALPRPPPPVLQMTVLDVGQGLAVVVRAGQRTLVYDTGPRYSDAFDAGADIIAPMLQRAGVAALDALVVSHAHDDHAGGAPGLLAALPSPVIYAGEPLPALAPTDSSRVISCHSPAPAASAWHWGEVAFQFLPLAGQRSNKGNNASCVLLITYQGHHWLLSGDIERPLEYRLLAELTRLQVDSIELLVAPHHGSKTSSSESFIVGTKPAYVVFSAGFNNRHGHPHPQVVARYQAAGAELFNTASDGAVRFYVDPTGATVGTRRRQQQRRPWRDPP
jgi:competence protein ComEC